jgi:hypothetical protein
MTQGSLESRAIELLESYEGSNNYILELQRRCNLNRKEN